MKTSINGIELIKEFEGLRLNAYRCQAGVWTIGYGHTGTVDGFSIERGMVISQDKATELLIDDLYVFEEAVNNLVVYNMNQNQFDALVSLAFNIGVNAFAGSTCRKRLNQGRVLDAAEALTWWNKVGDVVNRGLVKRRNMEKDLFLR